MMKGIARRTFVLGLTGVSSFAMLASAGTAVIDEQDPTAVALGYRSDAGKVDPSQNPTYRSGQTCGGCAQFAGHATDTTAPCNLFGGKSVNSKGWCRAWSQRS